jgi:hypothetical protein
VFNVSAQANNWAAWVNGQLLYQTSGNTFGYGTSGLNLGGSCNGFNGSIAEVLIFNRVLTAYEKDAVEGYLASKYDLSQYAANYAPPVAPAKLMATGVAPGQLNLHWTSTAANVYSFHVERALGTNGAFQEIGAVPSCYSNFVDTTASPTNTYYYRVKAHNLFGDSAYSAVISPPVISLTSYPATPLENFTNSITAQAAGANGAVSNVEFFAYHNLIQTDNLIGTAASAPYTVNWLVTMEGTWSLSALATDNQGNSQYSAPVTLTVFLDSNGDGIPDVLQVQNGDNPLNPWIPPTGDTNNVPPNIYLQIPTNAVLVP